MTKVKRYQICGNNRLYGHWAMAWSCVLCRCPSRALFAQQRLLFFFSNIWDGNESQNHRAESVYLLCKRGPRCPNTEKSNQSPISIKGGNSPRQPTKGSAFYIKLSEVAPPPLVQKHLTKFSLIFSCFAFQKKAIGCDI